MGPDKWSRADIRRTRHHMVLRVFSVSKGILGLERFDRMTIAVIFTGPKRMVPGRVWMMDNFWEKQFIWQIFPIYSHLQKIPNPMTDFIDSCLDISDGIPTYVL